MPRKGKATRATSKSKSSYSIVSRNDSGKKAVHYGNAYPPAVRETLAEAQKFEVMKTGFSMSGKFPWNSIDLTIPLYNVGNPGTSSSSYSRMADAINYVAAGPVGPMGNVWEGGNPISKLGSKILGMFSKVLPISMSLHYRPQCSTTNAEPLYFAYSVDPNNPSIWGYDGGASLGANAWSYLQDHKYARQFAPWESWDCPIAMEDVKSLYVQTGISNPYGYNDSTPTVNTFTDREGYFGSVSVKSRYAGSGYSSSNPVYGIIYLKASMKLIDFGLTSVSLFFSDPPPGDDLPPGIEIDETTGMIATVNGPLDRKEYIAKRKVLWLEKHFHGFSQESKDSLLTIFDSEAKARESKREDRKVVDAVLHQLKSERKVRDTTSDYVDVRPARSTSVPPPDRNRR